MIDYEREMTDHDHSRPGRCAACQWNRMTPDERMDAMDAQHEAERDAANADPVDSRDYL